MFVLQCTQKLKRSDIAKRIYVQLHIFFWKGSFNSFDHFLPWPVVGGRELHNQKINQNNFIMDN